MTSFELVNAIEDYVLHEQALAAIKPIIKERDALREKLLQHAISEQGDDPEKTLTLTNEKHTLTWTPREEQRQIADMGKVRKRLGLALFTRLVTLTLKKLDAHIPEVEQEQLGLTITQRTGPREVKVTAKAMHGRPCSTAPVVVKPAP